MERETRHPFIPSATSRVERRFWATWNETQDYALAIEVGLQEFRRVVAVAPDDPILRANYARFLTDMGTKLRLAAQQQWFELIRRRPEDARIDAAMGGWFQEQGDLRNAEAALRQALRQQTADPRAQYLGVWNRLQLAEVLRQQGQEEAAQQESERAFAAAEELGGPDLVKRVRDQLGQLGGDGALF
jgi:Tfp pilus assembly protein PilF